MTAYLLAVIAWGLMMLAALLLAAGKPLPTGVRGFRLENCAAGMLLVSGVVLIASVALSQATS